MELKSHPEYFLSWGRFYILKNNKGKPHKSKKCSKTIQNKWLEFQRESMRDFMSSAEETKQWEKTAHGE